MSVEREEISDGERDALSAIATDSLGIFRASLYVLVMYGTTLSLTLQIGGQDYIQNIVNSSYTINGAVFWMGSVTMSVLAYRMARRVTLQNHFYQLGAVDDKFDIMNFATAAILGLCISVFSLIFGLIDGWGTTVNESAGGIGIEQPLFLFGFTLVFVFSIYTLLSVIDIVRQKWGPLREKLP